MNTDLMFSSATDNWATPQDFFNKLNEKYNFNLDPCASKENHKCENYFTQEQDWLTKKRTLVDEKYLWQYNFHRTDRNKKSIVFCNPPYWKVLKDWVKKASEEIKEDYCETIVMLIPARTDTKYFHEYIYKKENVEIEFIKWRLIFWSDEYWKRIWDTEFLEDWKSWFKKNPLYKKYWVKNSAPFPSMLVIFKNNRYF